MQYATENKFSANDIIYSCKTLKDNGIKHISIDQIKLQMHSTTNMERKNHGMETPKYTYITDTAQQARQIEKEAENALDCITSYLSGGNNVTTIQAVGNV